MIYVPNRYHGKPNQNKPVDKPVQHMSSNQTNPKPVQQACTNHVLKPKVYEAILLYVSLFKKVLY